MSLKPLTFDDYSKQYSDGYGGYGRYLSSFYTKNNGMLDITADDLSLLGSTIAKGGVDATQQVMNNIKNQELLNLIGNSEAFRNSYSNGINKLYGIEQENSLNKAKIDYLNASTSAQEANRALGITSGVFQGLGALTNTGLGIWGAIESNKNLKKQREVADKQIALAQEQIDASREYRAQRRDEIERLNRVRSNTTKAFNTGSVITRSY